METNESNEQKQARDGIFLSKQTIDKMLRHKCSDDMIALYVFLSYTALWQRTNQPRANISFIAKGLRWGVNKVRRIKALLVRCNMIEDLCAVDPQSKRITGWYIRISYFHPHGNNESGNGEATLTVSPQCGFQTPKCFKVC